MNEQERQIFMQSFSAVSIEFLKEAMISTAYRPRMDLNIRARVIPVSKMELDPPDFIPTAREPCSDPSKAKNKAIIVDLSTLLGDDEVFFKVSAFLIDLFEYTEDPYVFYSLCQYAGQKYIPMDVFINAVQSDCDFVEIIKIDSIGDVKGCYEKYLKHSG